MGERESLESAAATLEQNFVLIEAEIDSMEATYASLSAFPGQLVPNSERDAVHDYLHSLKKARVRNRIAYWRITRKLDPLGDLYLFTPGDPVALSAFGLIPKTSGYCHYVDETSIQNFIAGSPGVLTMVPTTTNESQKPVDVPAYLSDGYILGLDGDAMEVQIQLLVRPTDIVDTATSLTAWLAIGSDLVTRVFPQDFALDGYDIPKNLTYKVSAYVGAAWASLGARLVVVPDAPVEIAARTLMVTRLHKGRPT